MLLLVSTLFLAASGLGLLALVLQLHVTRRHLRERRLTAAACPPVSILKPLCGADDELALNLACFAGLDYPEYEVLLGVKHPGDPAYPVAVEAARNWPGRMRVVLQRGEPGLNPKVNQLITLEASARFDLLVVSDSNARVPPHYLREIAAYLADPAVGCVTHPVAGTGEVLLGSRLDNLHLASSVAPGMIAAQRVAGQDLVVGKSMALRRSDLRRLGGFAALKDVLAEDYVFGRQVRHVLGKRVAVARTPVQSVSCNKSLADFLGRYMRWSVIHRTSVKLPTYLAQSLLHPLAWAGAAVLLHPSALTWTVAAAITSCKIALDLSAWRVFGARRFGPRELLAVPLKDALLFIAWVNGLFRRTVVWRGNHLRVQAGTRLVPLDPSPSGNEEVAWLRPL